MSLLSPLRSLFPSLSSLYIGIAILFLCAESSAAPLTPIARWDVVPHQRIKLERPFNCGVIAFSKAGIDHITFHINGKRRRVAGMTLNPRTGVHEYWIPIAVKDCPTEGPIKINATVHGKDGGKRELPPLPVVGDPAGALPRRQAWVDAISGDDATGVTGDRERPFRTIGRAMDGIRQWMKTNGHGNRADGGVIRLKPGNHAMSNGGIWREIPTVNEWITITRDTEGTQANTIINRFSGALQTRLLKIAGVTLQSPRNHGYVIRGTTKYEGMNVWVDDCALLGAGRHLSGSHPIHHGNLTIWSTNSLFTNLPSAVGGHRIARGLTIRHISDDVSRHCPLLVNCVADDVDPGQTYAHSDTWQSWLPDEPNNTIAYNVRVTDAHYQGIMCRTGKKDAPIARGVAFVNCFIELRPPIRPPHRGAAGGSGNSLWMRSVDHFLMWHCSLLGQSLNFFHDKAGNTQVPTTLTNASIVGCCFGNLGIRTAGCHIDTASFKTNHIVAPGGIHSVSPGSNVSTGDPALDSKGVPKPRSPLTNRLTQRLVPIDALGRPRDERPDIGAFEFIAGD